MFSIDQNCHSLWDVIPKLQVLVRRGLRVTHLQEDIDVAYTSLGASESGHDRLRLVRERFYRSGGQDWGAALFYYDFLGRLPVEIRHWEPFTGMKTRSLAKELDRSVDDLYDDFSPGDSLQLVGPSYFHDPRLHRVIGDLRTHETAGFVRELMNHAREDMRNRFPSSASRARIDDWFAQENARLAKLLAANAGGHLADVYRDWLNEYLDAGVALDATSTMFSLDADPARLALLEIFLRDYDLAAGLYNEAVREAGTDLRELDTAAGELPFFATLGRDAHMLRTGATLAGDSLVIGDRSIPLAAGRRFPLDELAVADISCIAGKAILLVMQACVGGESAGLALPYRGSLYMPAVKALARKLREHRLLPGELHPIVRVRLRLLDRMAACDTPIHLPPHLSRAMGREEVPAKELAAAHEGLATAAQQRLDAFCAPGGREKWQQANLAEITREIQAMDLRRRELAARKAAPEDIRPVWKQLKIRKVELLDRTLRQISDDWQTRDLDYWDSRGAILPWCVAVGGLEFYDRVITEAEIYEEPF